MTRLTVEADGVGCLVVRWQSVGEEYVDIALGPTPEAMDHAHVLRVVASAQSARLTGLPAGRHYVSLSDRGSAVVAAERRVSFEGVRNFRDLGGYPTASGGQTRWGQVFRSDSLHNLTPDDLAAFDGLGVRLIYDLRRDDERERQPGPRPALHLTLPSRRVGDDNPLTLRERIEGERWLFEDYRGMLAGGGTVFGRLFSQLAQPDGVPAVFHCTGGKDRTGMAAALLLSWLGVDHETVLDDYELTNRYLCANHVPEVVDLFVTGGIARPAAVAMLSAPRWAMAEALNVMDRVYGGIETYLRGPCGMTHRSLELLRARLVA
ncbi:MAG: tyrosine-protein phosphatase [Actinomycetota bacterium]|nr:tyrosine-protein phosphatase [Actinomycetota bacterium]